MREPKDPDSQLPLTPLSLQILVVLSRGPTHGYAIVKAVVSSPTSGSNPGTGSFYSAIRRMVGEGLIADVDAPSDGDARRRHYGITEFGLDVLAKETARLQCLLGDLVLARPGSAKQA